MRKHLTFWNVGLVCILFMGAVFLLTGWDRGLPLYESVDEVVNLDEIYALRGLSGGELSKPGYPPGILYVNYGAQIAAEVWTGESAWNHPCLTISNVRLAGVIANLMTALLVAFSARKLSNDAGGLLAALAWLAAPLVLLQTQYGFPQVYENLMVVLVLVTGLLALEKRSVRFALLCTLAGLGAVVFKYATFPVLAVGVGIALWHMRIHRQRWLRVLGVQLGMIAVTAGLLVAFGGVASLVRGDHMETEQFLESGMEQVFDGSLILHIHSYAFGQLGWALPVFAALLLTGTFAFWNQSKGWQRLGGLGALFLVFSHTLFFGTYIAKLDVGRNLLTVSGVVAIISAAALIALGRSLGQLMQRPALGHVAVAAISVLWLGPQIAGAWELIQYRDLPVTYSDLVTWTDQTMPEETLLVSDGRPFTRQWSCYRGHWRETVDAEITDQPIEDWLEDNIYYAQLEQDEVQELQASPTGRAYLDQMTLLKRFPPPGETGKWRTWRRGEDPEIALYQLWPVEPDVPTTVVFGDQIRLLGYNLSRPAPGDQLTLQFYWQPTRPPEADYNVFIHLGVPGDPTSILAQTDGYPGRSDLRPTSTWDNLDERFISHEFSLTLPDDLPPGDYALRVGLYDWHTGERLTITGGSDYFVVPVTIAET